MNVNEQVKSSKKSGTESNDQQKSQKNNSVEITSLKQKSC